MNKHFKLYSITKHKGKYINCEIKSIKSELKLNEIKTDKRIDK